MSTIINASTSSGLVQTADTSGTLELQSNGTTQLTVGSTGAYGQLKSATAQASTSGTSIDFTSIPSWVKRITVMFNGVSTNGTSLPQVQLGAGSIVSTGYANGCSRVGVATNTATSTTGFLAVAAVISSDTFTGALTITMISANTWIANGNILQNGAALNNLTAGNVTLSGTLDRVRITTVNGTDTFDAGSINILYEG